MISCLPEEYITVRTYLYMSSTYDYAAYKKYIRHYWYAELGGKEMTENGQSETYSGKKEGHWYN